MKRETKITDILFIIAFMAFLTAFGLGIFLNRSADRSELDGRIFENFPSSVSELFIEDGAVDRFDTAVRDHVKGRDHFIRLYYEMKLNIFHENYIGGNYAIKASKTDIEGLKGRVVPVPPYIEYDFTDEMQANLTGEIKAISDHCKKYGTKLMLFVYAPPRLMLEDEIREYDKSYADNSSILYERLKPALDRLRDEGIVLIDYYQLVRESGKKPSDLLYKTDHHWNLEGALLAANAISDELNAMGADIPHMDRDDLAVSGSAYLSAGSYARLLGKAVNHADTVEYFELKEPVAYNRFNKYSNMGKDVLYGEYLENAIPLVNTLKPYYGSYMDGDFPATKIENLDAPDKPSLLYAGDSYTNIIESFYYKNFSKLVSFDARSNTSSLFDYIDGEQPDYLVLQVGLDYISSGTLWNLYVDSGYSGD